MTMLVYHGTSLAKFQSIKKKGLTPRGSKKKSNWTHTIESNPDTIYFSDAYAMYFGLNAMNVDRGKDDSVVIIEVDTDDLPGALVADEDALEQVSRRQDGLPADLGMIDRTRHYRAMVREYADHGYGFEWSMKTLGTGGHIGAIPPEYFRRIAVIDVQKSTELAFAFMDCQVSVMNYRFVGARYRSLSRMIFGEPPHKDDYDQLCQLPLTMPPLGDGIKILTLESV